MTLKLAAISTDSIGIAPELQQHWGFRYDRVAQLGIIKVCERKKLEMLSDVGQKSFVKVCQ